MARKKSILTDELKHYLGAADGLNFLDQKGCNSNLFIV